MQKAVFLDRDGVLNAERGDYICDLNQFEILPHVIPNLQTLESNGFLLIVITNQGGIAKGLYDHQTLKNIHQKLINTLLESHVALTDIYYCPHHPDFGKCMCRKPGSLMIEKALSRYNIQPENSYMIGDADRDVQAATAAGIKSFKIESNTDWTPLLKYFT